MGYCLNRLDEPVFIAVSKPLLTEFGIHHRLESCAYLIMTSSILQLILVQFAIPALGLGMDHWLLAQNSPFLSLLSGARVEQMLGYSLSRGLRLGPSHLSKRFLAKMQNSSRYTKVFRLG